MADLAESFVKIDFWIIFNLLQLLFFFICPRLWLEDPVQDLKGAKTLGISPN